MHFKMTSTTNIMVRNAETKTIETGSHESPLFDVWCGCHYRKKQSVESLHWVGFLKDFLCEPSHTSHSTQNHDLFISEF